VNTTASEHVKPGITLLSFPHEHWRQIWSNNPLERLDRKIKRRTDVVGIFPDQGDPYAASSLQQILLEIC
jgi:transposase-like protein